MKYGDVVTYVKNDIEVNALVITHHEASDSMVLAYLDPANDSQGLRPPTPTIVGNVKPFDGKSPIGWKLIDDAYTMRRMAEKMAALQTTNTMLNERIAQLKECPNPGSHELSTAMLRLELKDGDIVFFDSSAVDGESFAETEGPDVVFIPVRVGPGMTLADAITVKQAKDATAGAIPGATSMVRDAPIPDNLQAYSAPIAEPDIAAAAPADETPTAEVEVEK